MNRTSAARLSAREAHAGLCPRPIILANAWQTNQPAELVTMPRFLGDKLGTALPVQGQRAYNADEGLHRL